MFRVIRRADLVVAPWKNGLGVTREIAVQTSEREPDTFLWRASIAEVDSDAPFSSFPGIDRHIMLLDGTGFEMTLDGTHRHQLRVPFEPFAFAGESTVSVRLLGGATRDFNLMVRRAEARGAVHALSGPGRHRLEPGTVLVLASRGGVDTPAGRLHSGDAWRIDAAPACEIALDAGAVALCVAIRSLEDARSP